MRGEGMRSESTLRRELRRLEGMRKRDGNTDEQNRHIDNKLMLVRWVLGRVNLRPSEYCLGLRARKGES